MTQRTVSRLAAGVVLCGAFGLIATFAADGRGITRHVVGAIAIVAFVLAAIALRRPGWTRLFLTPAGGFAILLALTAIVPNDDPMDNPLIAYVLFNTLIIVAAAPATLSVLDHSKGPSPRS